MSYIACAPVIELIILSDYMNKMNLTDVVLRTFPEEVRDRITQSTEKEIIKGILTTSCPDDNITTILEKYFRNNLVKNSFIYLGICIKIQPDAYTDVKCIPPCTITQITTRSLKTDEETSEFIRKIENQSGEIVVHGNMTISISTHHYFKFYDLQQIYMFLIRSVNIYPKIYLIEKDYQPVPWDGKLESLKVLFDSEIDTDSYLVYKEI